MLLEIKLSDNIFPEDILAWADPAGKNVKFHLFRSATFEAGAEGLALGYIADSIRTCESLELACEFSLPENESDFNSTLFATTFGFTLLRACKKATFANAPEDLSEELRTFAGSIYDDNKGVIGRGDRVGLIAFDPRRQIPRILLSGINAANKNEMPLPSAFHSHIINILSGMGLPEIASQSTLPILISFIFELFSNTLQHGLPKDKLVAKHSTRGIAFSKIAFSTNQLDTRRISPQLKNFLLRMAEIEKREKSLSVVCISVMDMGDGIQNTLPSNAEDETENDRLVRAFTMGQTRKTTGLVERGLGLQKVVEAAHRLGARLQVSSAGRTLVKDFSLGDDKLPNIDKAEIKELPTYFKNGTSVDIYIPKFSFNIDQRKLIL